MPKSQDNFDKNFDEINNIISQVESYIRLAFDNGDIKIIEKAENDLNKAKHLSDVYGVKLIKNKNRNGVEQYKKIGLMLNTLAEKKVLYSIKMKRSLHNLQVILTKNHHYVGL